MDFTIVSKELARSWGCLSKEEKENYKKLANERKKVVIPTKTNNVQSSKNIFEFKNLKRYSTKINIELSEIKRNILNKQEVQLVLFKFLCKIFIKLFFIWILKIHFVF